MARLMNLLLIAMLVLASSPDELFGSCFDSFEAKSYQVGTSSDQTHITYVDSHSDNTSDSNHDCSCPIHAHHCCSHISLMSSVRVAEVTFSDEISAAKLFYNAPFVSEPALDGLLRPPIV